MCATFLMVYTVVQTLLIFIDEYRYIKALAYEIPELLIYLAIGFLFRLRDFEGFENIELVPPRENVVIFELPDVCESKLETNVALGTPQHFKVEKETQTPRHRWRPSVAVII